jgi:hypothetical protein
MELTFECAGCHAVGRVAAVESQAEARCEGCQSHRELRRDAFEAQELRACPLCGTEDLYLQKDFPQGFGLTIVVVGFVISTVFWYRDEPLPALGVLLLSALADMALYYLVPDVTICYRCLSQYRGAGTNPEGRFRGFDLAVGERYRQERIRAEHLRSQGSTSGPTAQQGGE